METSGRAVTREASAPRATLRRLVIGPTERLSWPRNTFVRYAQPLGVILLVGLCWADWAYLRDDRGLHSWWALLISIAAVAPAAIAVRNPIVGWRFAFVALFIGTVAAPSDQTWPWSPVQVVLFLAVMALLAFTQDTAITVGATAISSVVPFLYAEQANAFDIAVLFMVVPLAADVVSRRRKSGRALAEQAELTELERARRAILEERTRIAREMHDVVAHHMSMIAVQAETAPFRVTDLSEPAKTELATIADSARSAMADMRRLLGVLRADDEQAQTAPQPGLDELPGLVDKARQAGIAVTVEATDLTGVPEAVGLAAYRIVQEALANAARHAPGGAVRIEAQAHDDRLELVVRNGMPAGEPAPAGDGHGLIGMRERAELLGGTLRTGPDRAGGFRVEVSLPYGGTQPA